MDNLTAHKEERVKELIEGRGCEVLYLPPYSPDYNPIEEAIAKIKSLMRIVPKTLAASSSTAAIMW
jgi:transposase